MEFNLASFSAPFGAQIALIGTREMLGKFARRSFDVAMFRRVSAYTSEDKDVETVSSVVISKENAGNGGREGSRFRSLDVRRLSTSGSSLRATRTRRWLTLESPESAVSDLLEFDLPISWMQDRVDRSGGEGVRGAGHFCLLLLCLLRYLRDAAGRAVFDVPFKFPAKGDRSQAACLDLYPMRFRACRVQA